MQSSKINPPPLAQSITDVIGNTPLLELAPLVASRNLQGRLLCKLEYLNPGFSKKDRIAKQMLLEAKRAGELTDGQTVIELTSGNTGTGLAIACKAMGHPFIAVISKGNTRERARQMQALGAEVVLVDQAPGSMPNQVSGDDLALVEQTTQRLVAERNAVRTNQFTHLGNRLAHELHTGPELWQQAEGKIDVLVDYAGSGGTFAGIITALRKQNPDIRGYLVEPASAPVLAGKEVTNPSHKIQGGGYNMPHLPLLDPALVTDYIQITDDDAAQGARDLAREAGVFAGFSTGAHFAAACHLLADREQGKTIAFLACDSGLKYLSTDLYPWQDA